MMKLLIGKSWSRFYQILFTSLALVLVGCGGGNGESEDGDSGRELNPEFRFSMSGTVDDVEIDVNTDDVSAAFERNQFDLEDNAGAFEFETEGIVPMEVGVYVIGEDGFEAVDMENIFTDTNLHAYKGQLEILSIDPLYQGTFKLTEFADDHGDPITSFGELTGYFSIPYDEIVEFQTGG